MPISATITSPAGEDEIASSIERITKLILAIQLRFTPELIEVRHRTWEAGQDCIADYLCTVAVDLEEEVACEAIRSAILGEIGTFLKPNADGLTPLIQIFVSARAPTP